MDKELLCCIRVYCPYDTNKTQKYQVYWHVSIMTRKKIIFLYLCTSFSMLCNFSIFGFFSSYGIAAIAPFSHRLAFDNMPEEIQRLRCKVNFQALVFVPHIISLGDSLVSRLRNSRSSSDEDGTNHLLKVTDAKGWQGTGKLVVLHLRFDKVCCCAS